MSSPRDPYAISGPTCISFSGGRTSAYMLRKILDRYEGILPPETHVLFANTGKEHPGTLDFVDRVQRDWSVPLVWLEYDGTHGYREVTHSTASRKGEPFDLLIKKQLEFTQSYFDVIMMDPPWKLSTSQPSRGVAIQYDSLSD